MLNQATHLSLAPRLLPGAERPQTSPDRLGPLEHLSHVVRDTSLCGLGQAAPNPVLSTLQHFRSEYEDLLMSEEAANA